MIVVDSSVWVAYFRGRDRRVAERLRALLDDDRVALAAPVRLELLLGIPANRFPRLRMLLSALPVFYPSEATWDLLDAWAEQAARAGERFGMGDLLIGAIAAERGIELWSLDRDFERLARLGLLRVYRPPP